ncbi:MAG: hypothetical protein J3K34DRAFT_480381 [Monoraphidium minutum]|nr:MAG: hypothetical protein J3K34DRAFT_480381 [Monoraphidium minutum]
MRSNSMGACPIPYPDRFYVARFYASRLPEGTLGDEPRLLLYALSQQAAAGPNTTPQPWGWNVVDSAKWQSWKQLGNMARMEAMRLYVKTLDEEQPEWWNRLPEGWEAAAAEANGAAAPGGGVPGAAGGGGRPSAGGAPGISGVVKEGEWVVISQDDGRKPLPRYEQGAALIGSQIFVLGGHYAGRYLEDFWIYDLASLQWSQATAAAAAAGGGGGGGGEAAPLLAGAALPPSAGHSVTNWGDKLLVVGGHTKDKSPKSQIAARILDPATMEWIALTTTGDAPCARGGHSATLVGDRLYVFGGEDSRRRPLDDLHILDLPSMEWSLIAVPGKPHAKPPPRCGHAAVVLHDKLVVFGGGSIANCLSDCWVLDLDTLHWTRPAAAGHAPSPRAGHASVLVGERWYILGGGNNVKGCTDMVCADLSEVSGGNVTWSRPAAVQAGSPLSCEGISLLHCPELGLLVAFGGYNGKYHNSVSVYKLPGGPTPPPPPPAAAADDAPQEQRRSASGDAGGERQASAAAPLPQQQQQANGGGESLLRDLAVQREMLKRELSEVRASAAEAAAEGAAGREAAAAELGLLRRQLAAAQGALGDAEKSLEDARHQLSAEQARTLKLEATVAELNERLGQVGDLERELARYRQMESDGKKGSGIWGYIAGN